MNLLSPTFNIHFPSLMQYLYSLEQQQSGKIQVEARHNKI